MPCAILGNTSNNNDHVLTTIQLMLVINKPITN